MRCPASKSLCTFLVRFFAGVQELYPPNCVQCSVRVCVCVCEAGTRYKPENGAVSLQHPLHPPSSRWSNGTPMDRHPSHPVHAMGSTTKRPFRRKRSHEWSNAPQCEASTAHLQPCMRMRGAAACKAAPQRCQRPMVRVFIRCLPLWR